MHLPYSYISSSDLTGRLFVVGDIHGCSDELKCMLTHLEKEERLVKEDTVIFVGDYIDRGSDSKGAVDLVIEFKRKFPRTRTLKGNHEEMLMSYLGVGGSNGEAYLINGGEKTFESYGLSPYDIDGALESFPKEHLDFFQDLERFIITDNFIVVHAGLDALRPLDFQPDSTICWIRDEFLYGHHNYDKVVVFGHTPFQDIYSESGFKLGIDTGLVYGNKLTCVELTRGRSYQIHKGTKKVLTAGLEW